MSDYKNAKIIFELMKVIHDFKKVKRAGWNKEAENGYKATKIKDAESVADHSYGLMFLCFIVGMMLDLDIKKMFILSLLHDLPEAKDGDEITATERDEQKRRKLEVDKRVIEEETMKRIFSVLEKDIQELYYSYFIEYLDQSSPEAKLVYQLDKIETILQAYNYFSDGEEVDPGEFLVSYENRIHEPLLKELLQLLKINNE